MKLESYVALSCRNLRSGIQCLDTSFHGHLINEQETVFLSPVALTSEWTRSGVVELRMFFFRIWSFSVLLESRCGSHQGLHEIQAF
jgi:hypothetical protein